MGELSWSCIGIGSSYDPVPVVSRSLTVSLPEVLAWVQGLSVSLLAEVSIREPSWTCMLMSLFPFQDR